jgi:hypothetical protein
MEMDKAEFIEKAPGYYALAIALAVKRASSPLTQATIEAIYPVTRTGRFGLGGRSLLDNGHLWTIAIEFLQQRNMIGIFKDTFGPSIYHVENDFQKGWDELLSDDRFPFKNFNILGEHEDWLHGALTNVAETFETLDIQPADFENPEREWEPIPLERNNESLQSAIIALDNTITQVEQSNGYASEHAEERNFVLDNLRMLSQKLKSAGTVSVSYVRTHGLSILKRLQDRFVDTSIGEGAKEARNAIVHWLHGVINYFVS